MRFYRGLLFCVPILIFILWVPWILETARADFDDKNVVIVLDASGSMDGYTQGGQTKKIDAAKSALREILQDIPEDTNIGLLVFGARNVPSGWA